MLRPPFIDTNFHQTFIEDGVACARGVISDEWIFKLRTAIDQLIASPAEFSRDLAEEANTPGNFYNEIFPARRNEILRDFIRLSPIAEIAATAMGCQSIRYFNDQLLVKEPGTSAETPWHQDLPYFPCDGEHICSVWVALDSVTRETGALSFVKGSHLTGKLYRPQNFGTGQDRGDEAMDGPVPDIDGNPAAFPTICYPLAPGDVTVHSARTLHGAKGNLSPSSRRRGYTIRLLGDGTVWRVRAYMPRGFQSLEDGAPISGDSYPLLWYQ